MHQYVAGASHIDGNERRPLRDASDAEADTVVSAGLDSVDAADRVRRETELANRASLTRLLTRPVAHVRWSSRLNSDPALNHVPGIAIPLVTGGDKSNQGRSTGNWWKNPKDGRAPPDGS